MWLYTVIICIFYCNDVDDFGNFISEGTHFYHAHTGNLRAEGTYGVLAFSSNTPRYHYDADFSLILADWYHESITELTAGEVTVSTSTCHSFVQFNE
jgi:FtsP/CotA-like multicopper oxidase with cupredoxin domain